MNKYLEIKQIINTQDSKHYGKHGKIKKLKN